MATQQIDEYYESLAYWKQQAQDYEQALRDIEYNTIMNMTAEIEQLKAENLELSNMYKQQIEKNYSLRVDKDAEIEQLKKENKKLFSVYEECRSDNTAHFRKILELQKENDQLKSKLKVAAEALNDLFNKAKDGSHYESIAREALKEIES